MEPLPRPLGPARPEPPAVARVRARARFGRLGGGDVAGGAAALARRPRARAWSRVGDGPDVAQLRRTDPRLDRRPLAEPDQLGRGRLEPAARACALVDRGDARAHADAAARAAPHALGAP